MGGGRLGVARAEGAPVRFQLLGPVQLLVRGEPVAVGGTGVRGLLALLALEANRVVPVEYLIDRLWDHEPPPTARTIVQGNVSHLRRVLRTAQGLGRHEAHEDVRIDTAPRGYRLTVDPELVDAHRARSLLERAAVAALPQRAQLLATALSLWQGTALGGVPHSVRAPELDELWLALHGERVDAELDQGRHAELIVELTQLVRQRPTVERTVGQLMLALYRSGRRGDALDVYRSAARDIATELGIDPGPELIALHERLLADDPAEVPRDEMFGGPVPAQLPAAVPGLAGRQDDLDWLDGLRAETARGGAAVGVVTGTAGIGKSSLVVAWAQRAAESFPDGVLFAGLRGCDPNQVPSSPVDVLDRFLRALGVPGAELPAEPDERVALYRSLLARSTVLVLLDDAASVAQVRPLLPPGGRSLAVITSRARLDELAVSYAARHRPLSTLAPDAAVRLIDELAGVDAAGANHRVAELCGYLPLALRIAGARLAAGAQWTSEDLVQELDNERTRLAALDVPGSDTSVRAALDVSFRGLPVDAAAALRSYGVLATGSIDPHHLAAAAEVNPSRARGQLRTLATHHLLTETDRDAFGAHDLVRLYAMDLAESGLDASARDAILHRSLTYYLATADLARRKLLRIVDPLEFTGLVSAGNTPAFDSFDAAASWFEREWESLIATLERARAAGRHEQVWQLARLVHTYRVVRPSLAEWTRLVELGLSAAEDSRSELGRCWMLISRCAVALTFGHPDGCLNDAEAALRIATGLGDDRLVISANIHLGCALNECGRQDEAIACLRAAIADTERIADPALRGQALNNCAEAEKNAGLHAEAIAHQLGSLEIDRSLGDDSYAVVSLNNLAEMHLAVGELREAEAYARESIELTAARGFTLQEGVSRLTLGRILRAGGDLAGATAQLTAALERHKEVGSRQVDPITDELVELGRPAT